MHGLRDGLAGRIIPAYAGSTARPRSIVVGSADHPRIRGEHLVTIGSSMLPSGSSPHTRGARDLRRSRALLPGIIPAYAGSTAPEAAGQDRKRDHPRIRGEHHLRQDGQLLGTGSSPHTRGAREYPARVQRTGGIIPAYAGSTRFRPGRALPDRDHPRIRGEHRLQGMPVRPDQGSSPHTRGAPKKREDPENAARIIPAYAGSTSRRSILAVGARDHPRIRGEHRRGARKCSSTRGSSPHTRGALGYPAYDFGDPGIIPAYAGSTDSAPSDPENSGDHPRIRGEHVKLSYM